jgi:uncharacterized membrane protein (DUF485 family)
MALRLQWRPMIHFNDSDAVAAMNDRAQQMLELADLKARVAELEAQVAEGTRSPAWAPKEFYGAYYATTGFLLGIFGALASLIINIVGAPLAGKSALELIRVYLTFPLGENALRLASENADVYSIGDGVMLAIGCCLYLGTGMLLGVPFYTILGRLTEGRTNAYRFLVATILAVVMWFVNFYLLLSWIQPALIGGRWITDPKILPPWVAVLTHLVFGWTLAAIYSWGSFHPYQMPATAEHEASNVER